MKKRLISLLLALVMVLSVLPIPHASAAATYSVDKAITYAKAHWNDGVGLCAAFVSRCVMAGGLNTGVKDGTGNCWRAIEKLSGLKKQDVKLNSKGYATKALNGDNIAAGDVMVQWCKTHKIAPHILLCGGYDSSGYATFYAHNGALNNKKYNLGTNTSYDHTTKCDMGGQVIRLSTLDPSKSAPGATFSNEVTPATYSATLSSTISYTGPNAPSSYGVLFGTSKDNLHTYTTSTLSTTNNPFTVDLSFAYLEHNTIYYYQPYVVIGGKTYSDSIRSFATTKDTASISVVSEIHCGYNITVPANADLFFYGSPTSKEPLFHQPALDYPQTLFCTARLFMSDNTVRYLYSSQGMDLYFRVNSTMTFKTVHNYDQQKADAAYLVSEATCTEQAVYKKSCSCGEAGTDTFRYGNLKDHVYDQQKADSKYLVSEATSTSPAIYYKSCICGEAGTDTFKYGNLKPQDFQDVPKNIYYYAPVMWAVENGITTGTGANTFSPDATCTRGQVVTFLWRAAGKPEPVDTRNPFVDVKTTDFFYKAVLWAKENGITTGTGDGSTFEPDKDCNRGQIVTFLYRAVKGTTVNSNKIFKDVMDTKAFYYNPVMWAVSKGITTGTGDGSTFEPSKDCSRAQVITFLYRAYTN